MHWYAYAACFLAGTALTCGVPHFIKGICGEPFPASFATPFDKVFSSPVANVLDGILDFIIGGVLFIAGHVSPAHPASLVVFIAGVAFASVLLSHHFGKQRPADPASPKTPSSPASPSAPHPSQTDTARAPTHPPPASSAPSNTRNTTRSFNKNASPNPAERH